MRNAPPLQRVFIAPDGRLLEIRRSAWEMLQQFRQSERSDLEAGGVLLGRYLHNGITFLVDAITTPMSDDRRSRTRFFRSQAAHQAMIEQVWHESEGICTYLGEWHTHPELIPTPSSIDWNDWKRRLTSDRYTEPLFFVIVGIAKTRIWMGDSCGSIQPLVHQDEYENG